VAGRGKLVRGRYAQLALNKGWADAHLVDPKRTISGISVEAHFFRQSGMDAGVAVAAHRSHVALVPALRGESGHQMGTGPTAACLADDHASGGPPLGGLADSQDDEFGLAVLRGSNAMTAAVSKTVIRR
jgi:hypothetical protein